MNKKYLFFLVFTVLICCKSKMIQQSSILKEKTNITVNSNKHDIRTILLHKVENKMSLPIINLNSNDKLKLSFDDISNDLSYFYLTIDHYDSKWKKSNLLKSEFIEGFDKDESSK